MTNSHALGSAEPTLEARLQLLRSLTKRIDWTKPRREALEQAGFREDFDPAIWPQMTWYGFLEPLIADEAVSDILLNGTGKEVRITRAGADRPSGITPHPEWVTFVCEQLLQRSGRAVFRRPGSSGERSDLWPAHMVLGSTDRRLRFALTRPPATPDGITMAIRVFPRQWHQLDALVARGTLCQAQAALLIRAMQARTTILVSGETGVGKTTLAGALLLALGEDRRVITVEDPLELPRLADSVHLEVFHSRMSFKECVRFTLRQKPDFIVVGELRGGEALPFLQGAASGHPGIGTIHGDSAQAAIGNLERMACESGELPPGLVRSYLALGTFPLLLVQLGRAAGRVCVTSIHQLLIQGGGGDVGDPFPLSPLWAMDLRTGTSVEENAPQGLLGDHRG
jgi:pilus assembly protein CpaF